MSVDNSRPRDGLPTQVGIGSIRGYATGALTATTLLGAGIWLSTVVRPSPEMRDIILFAHLGFLVLGFGAVLVADYYFALWTLRRATLAEALAATSRLHLLIWMGLAGLTASGALLQPDLSSGLTILKLGFVAVLTLNGVQLIAVDRRMRVLDGPPPLRLLVWGAVTAAISQTSWWGAIVIGFLNVNR